MKIKAHSLFLSLVFAASVFPVQLFIFTQSMNFLSAKSDGAVFAGWILLVLNGIGFYVLIRFLISSIKLHKLGRKLEEHYRSSGPTHSCCMHEKRSGGVWE